MKELHTTQNGDLSALMDSELHGPAQRSAIASVLSEPQVRSAWHAYHVVGDVLRSEELSGAAQDLQFLEKLEARLALEPHSQVVTSVIQSPIPTMSARRLQSANDPVVWRVLAGVACSVLVAVIGVSVWSPAAVPPSVSLVVVAPPAPTADLPQSVSLEAAVRPDGMIRDPRLDQLLSAHQQLGGHSALQMPSGFLRNATYEGAGR